MSAISSCAVPPTRNSSSIIGDAIEGECQAHVITGVGVTNAAVDVTAKRATEGRRTSVDGRGWCLELVAFAVAFFVGLRRFR